MIIFLQILNDNDEIYTFSTQVPPKFSFQFFHSRTFRIIIHLKITNINNEIYSFERIIQTFVLQLRIFRRAFDTTLNNKINGPLKIFREFGVRFYEYSVVLLRQHNRDARCILLFNFFLVLTGSRYRGP